MTITTNLCSRCHTPLEKGDVRCAICGQAAPSLEEQRDEVAVQVLRCTGCGAAVAYDPNLRAPACSFCGSVMQVETPTDPVEQTQGYLPFTVDQETAKRTLRHWLGGLGWFRPTELRQAARIERLTPIWWVGWVFDAEALVSWTGDSDADAQRSAWAPYAGQTPMEFDDILVSASRGLSYAEVDAVAPGYDLETIADEPQGAVNPTLEQFDLQRSQARQSVIYAVQRVAASRVGELQIPGTRSRNVNVSVILRNLITRRLSFPAYILAYRYKERLYRVVISGQNPRLITGSAPYSFAKIALVVFLAGLGILFFLLLTGAFMS